METTLGQLEGKFVRVRDKIVSGKRIDGYDRAYLAAFMATMHSRTNPVAESIKEFTQDIDSRVRQIEDVIKSGEIEKIYAKWFTSPVPPKGINMNFAMTPPIREAFKNPNDKGVQ